MLAPVGGRFAGSRFARDRCVLVVRGDRRFRCTTTTCMVPSSRWTDTRPGSDRSRQSCSAEAGQTRETHSPCWDLPGSAPDHYDRNVLRGGLVFRYHLRDWQHREPGLPPAFDPERNRRVSAGMTVAHSGAAREHRSTALTHPVVVRVCEQEPSGLERRALPGAVQIRSVHDGVRGSSPRVGFGYEPANQSPAWRGGRRFRVSEIGARGRPGSRPTDDQPPGARATLTTPSLRPAIIRKPSAASSRGRVCVKIGLGSILPSATSAAHSAT